MPQGMHMDYNHIIEWVALPFDGLANAHQSLWNNSTDAYLADIESTRAKARALDCEWALES